jgi:benzoyl-CoA reductase/2-hydroxyglutaryl-CoA dehydratase subunit BcrC/BadD/HgdB
MKRLWLREHEKEEIEKEIAHLSQRLGKRAGQPAGVLVRRHTEELPLPEKHVKVLRYLAKQASAVMQTDVAQSTDISEKTVSGICRELTRLRFTSKPLDRKTGVIITQKGRDHLGKCADDSKK